MTDKSSKINVEPLSIIPVSDHDPEDKTYTPHQYSSTSDSSFILTPTENQKLNYDATAAASMSNGHNEGRKDISKSKVFGNEKAESRYKLWLRFEMFALAVIIVIIWGLFALPIVFYHLPVGSYSQTPPMINRSTMSCSTRLSYDGSVCRQELSALTSCLPVTEQDGVIYIQRDESSNVGQLLSALQSPLLGASEECKAAALPFLCVYFFGLCDSTGRAYRPSSSQCTEISTGVCAREWMLASNFPGVILPECSSFPDETILMESCDNVEADNFASGSASTSMGTHPVTDQTCTCSEDFFCKSVRNNGSDDELVCVPECGSWEEYPHITTVIIDIVVILAASIGIISGIALLVIAGVRRKKVFVFPSVFSVYQSITLLVFGLFVLINYMDRTWLFCSSKDLLEAAAIATPFCVVSAIVFHYAMLQLALWWLFHIMALYWKIRFPFHARRFEAARRVRYIHFTAVVLALVIPAIPIFIAMIEYAVEDSKDGGDSSPAGNLGFGLIRFPPILCTGNDRNITYYTMVLPLNLIVIIGIALLVLVFWIIHKQHGLFRVKQSKNPFKIGTAERKILIVFLYYVALVVVALISFTISTRNVEQFVVELFVYFNCESKPLGTRDQICSREGFERLTQPVITSITYALLGLFPLVSLTFVINIQEVKGKIEQCLPKIHHHKPHKPVQRSTSAPSSSSYSSDPSTTGTAISLLKRAQE